ncbi:ING1 ike protein with an N-terminal globular domain and a PHD domain [Cryptosporidium felis]|nr:ING1 ike protein with an N-terminal globular domain and a PHD domain [Cryptosporidium felis]
MNILDKKNEDENETEDTIFDEMVPCNRISRILKFSVEKKFSRASTNLIQYTVTKFIREVAKLSEKQSRIRNKKLDEGQSTVVREEDVFAAIKRGGKKFSFVNFSTEFLEDNFWKAALK